MDPVKKAILRDLVKEYFSGGGANGKVHIVTDLEAIADFVLKYL